MRLALTEVASGEEPREALLGVFVSLCIEERFLVVGGVAELSDASFTGCSGEVMIDGRLNNLKDDAANASSSIFERGD